MLYRDRNGRKMRKSSFSGVHNDCVFVTSPTETEAEVEDSKTETSLRMSSTARNRLVALVASGALALGIFGILGVDMTHNTANWTPLAARCAPGMTHDVVCR